MGRIVSTMPDRFMSQVVIFESTFSWFGNFRRIVLRNQCQLRTYEALIQIACVMILTKRLRVYATGSARNGSDEFAFLLLTVACRVTFMSRRDESSGEF